jgi:TolB-like protein/Tfp pilus assembly protein PilF
VSAAVTLGVVYGLVRRWGLPAWALGLAAGLLAVGAGVLVATGRFEERRRVARPTAALGRWFTWRNAGLGGALAAVLWVAVALLVVFRGPVRGGVGDVTRLAVLPFENLGAAEDAYFAEGIADEIRGKLLALPGFAVIARSSSVQYRGAAKPLPEIGRELGAQYLLTATVRWSKGSGQADRVQVVPELVDARSGEVRWQQSFDAAITDVFAVQASIASRVAQELNVALGVGVRERLAQPPTANVAAYDAYLRGEEASQGLGTTQAGPLREALAHYERAVSLDSTFVEAWARLSRTECRLNSTTLTVSGVERCRTAAERALTLAPDRPEGHHAMGEYLRIVKKDHAGALAEYTAGLRTAPNNADLLAATAAVERSLGRWAEGLAHLEQAYRIDPRAVLTARRLASAYAEQHRSAEALAQFDRALALAPTNLATIQGKSSTYLQLGDLAGARRVIAEALRRVDTTALVAHFAIFQEQMWVLPDNLRLRVIHLRPSDFDEDRGMWALKVGGTYRLMGDSARARAYGDSSRMAMEERIRTFPDDAQLTELLGRALALAGRNAAAVRAGERSLALRETTMDAVTGPYYRYQVARIFIQVGQYDRALDLIEPLLGGPGDLTPGWLRVDPIFDPLRGNPRFDRLAAER